MTSSSNSTPVTPYTFHDVPALAEAYRKLFEKKSTFQTQLTQEIDRAQSKPQLKAELETTRTEFLNNWKAVDTVFLQLHEKMTAPGVTQAQRDETMKLLAPMVEGGLSSLDMTAASLTNTVELSRLPAPAQRTAEQRTRAEELTRKNTDLKTQIAAIRARRMDGTLFGGAPVNRELAATLTSAGAAVTGFVDDVCSGRFFTNVSNAISSTVDEVRSNVPGNSTVSNTGTSNTVTNTNPFVVADNRSWWQKAQDWVSGKSNGEQSGEGDGQNAAGKWIGGIGGVGLAYLISSMFGSGPFQWVLLFLLAPLMGYLGATKMGGTINNWLGLSNGTANAQGGPSPSLQQGQANAQAQGQSNGQSNAQDQGQGNGITYGALPGQPYRYLQGNQLIEIPQNGGVGTIQPYLQPPMPYPQPEMLPPQHPAPVYSQVRDVRIGAGVRYEPEAPVRYQPDFPSPTEALYYGARDFERYNGRNRDYNGIDIRARGDVTLTGVTVSGADMAGVSVDGRNMGQRHSQVKLRFPF